MENDLRSCELTAVFRKIISRQMLCSGLSEIVSYARHAVLCVLLTANNRKDRIFVEEGDIRHKDRPSRPPDLNLIEHIWDGLGQGWQASGTRVIDGTRHNILGTPVIKMEPLGVKSRAFRRNGYVAKSFYFDTFIISEKAHCEASIAVTLHTR
ncbi:hypothetical protein TNCV_1599771 [Trichonephila clavipes]|nr:hypothetical protein TNCV_1599771 [Trichonephila clavipes]